MDKISGRSFRTAHVYCCSAGEGVGDSQDTGDNAHQNTADVGVVGFLIDLMADIGGQGQDQDNGEQPDAHDTGDGIQNLLAGDEEGGVLDEDHHCRSQGHEEHLPGNRSPFLLSLHIVVAVAGDTHGDVIHQPEGDKDQNPGQVGGAEGPDGSKAPEPVVCQEQVIRQEHQTKGCTNHSNGEQCGFQQLGFRNPAAPDGLIDGGPLIGTLQGQQGPQAAECTPQSDDPGGTLVPDVGLPDNIADDKGNKIEQNAHQGGNQVAVDIFFLSLCFPEGQGLALCFQILKIPGIQQSQGTVQHKHKETDDAQAVEGGLPLPDLIGMGKFLGSIQSAVKEVHAEGDHVLGEMSPGMRDSGVIDGPDGTLSIGVEHIRSALFQSLGICAEMEEGLGGHLVDVFSGGESIHPVEKFVILAGYDGGIPAAKLVVEFAVLVIIHCVIGNEQGSGDKTVMVLKYSLPAGQGAVGVAGDTNAACIHEGQTGDVFDAVIEAVCVVGIVPPGAVQDNLGIAVAVHGDGQHHIAPACIFDIVQILHFPVVVPAMADHDGRSGGVSGGIVRHQEQGIQLVAGVGDKGHVVIGDGAKVCLEDGGTHRAEKALHQSNGKIEFYISFHGNSLLSCLLLYRHRSECQQVSTK